MIEHSGGGAVVNISSISALRPRGMTAYSTSKGAIMALTAAMAVDHGVDGVRVNCVAPGPVRTPLVGGDEMPDELAEARRRASVLKIEGNGWDVGAAVQVPVHRRGPLHHRPHARRRRRRDPARTFTGLAAGLNRTPLSLFALAELARRRRAAAPIGYTRCWRKPLA